MGSARPAVWLQIFLESKFRGLAGVSSHSSGYMAQFVTRGACFLERFQIRGVSTGSSGHQLKGRVGLYFYMEEDFRSFFDTEKRNTSIHCSLIWYTGSAA